MRSTPIRVALVVALVAAAVSCAGNEDQAASRSRLDSTTVAPGAADSPGPGRVLPPRTPDTTTSNADILTPDGWGPLRIGMTRTEVVAAAGDDANPGAVGGADPAQCEQFRPRRAPAGLLVMIEQGRLTRISLSRGDGIATQERIRVGDPASKILDAYGSRAEVTPHKYSPSPAKYITIWRAPTPPSDRRGIRYEIGPENRVAHIHAGGPAIEYVEGCS